MTELEVRRSCSSEQRCGKGSRLRQGKGQDRPEASSAQSQEKPQQSSEVKSQAVADRRTEVSMEIRGTGSVVSGPGKAGEGGLGA